MEEKIILKDFPPGPLTLYRKQASFDWKKLKLYIEDEHLLKFKVFLKKEKIKTSSWKISGFCQKNFLRVPNEDFKSNRIIIALSNMKMVVDDSVNGFA